MTRRQWFGSLFATAVAAVCAPCVSGKDDPTLIHIYKLDSNGINPRRVRMHELRRGDLFMTYDPSTQRLSTILRAEGDPCEKKTPDGFIVPHTWSIICGRP